MNARQHADFNRDLADLVEAAPIGTNAILGHLLAEDSLAHRFVILRQLLLGVRIPFGKLLGQLVLDLLDQRVAFRLGMGLGVERVLQPVADLGLKRSKVSLIELDRSHDTLWLPCLGNQLVDRGADLLDLGVAEFDGIDHRLFADAGGAALDHHHAVFCGDDGDIQLALEPLSIGGIDDELAIHLAHAHRADRAAEGNIGKRQGRARGIDADHVGIVFFIRGQDQGNHLGLIAEIFGEHGADGAVDLAAGENLTLAGTAFALDKAAGNAATGIGVFAVIHGQGEKIEAFFGIRSGHGGGQNHVVTLGHEHGARGLLGHAACFKSQSLATGKLDSHFLFHKILISYVHKGRGAVQRAG